MASLRESRGKDGGFVLCFWYGGRKYNRKLGTADRKEAEARRKRAEATLHDLETGWRTLPSDCTDPAVFILSDGRAAGKVAVPAILTLRSVWDRYLAELPDTAKDKSTRQTEKLHFGHLLRILKPSTPYATLQAADIQKYIKHREKEPGRRGGTVKAATIKKEVDTFKAVWNGFALPHKLVKETFKAHFGKLTFPKEESKYPFQTLEQVQGRIERNGLTPEEQAALWDCLFLDATQVEDELQTIRQAPVPPWLYPMAVCAAHTGARLSELVRSEPDDFDLEAGTVHWREKKRDKTKDYSMRSVEMTPRLVAIMREWLATRPAGKLTFGIRRKLTAWEQLKRAVKGTKYTRIRGWHLFRHSLASILAAAGTDQRTIDATLGHQTEDMRKRYRHLFPSKQRAALASVFDSAAVGQ